MWEQIRSNQMRSAFLIGVLGALLLAVGYFLGAAFAETGIPGLIIAPPPPSNAFATGRSRDKTAVTVPSGLLQNLNRDELQGVIGHEISHIKNRDVLLMSLSSVLLGTIVLLAWYASRVMLFGGMGRSRRSSSSSGGGAQLIILVVAIVLMILAPIMAQLI